MTLLPHEGHGFWSDTMLHALVDHGALALALVCGLAVVGGVAWARRRER